MAAVNPKQIAKNTVFLYIRMLLLLAVSFSKYWALTIMVFITSLLVLLLFLLSSAMR